MRFLKIDKAFLQETHKNALKKGVTRVLLRALSSLEEVRCLIVTPFLLGGFIVGLTLIEQGMLIRYYITQAEKHIETKDYYKAYIELNYVQSFIAKAQELIKDLIRSVEK